MTPSRLGTVVVLVTAAFYDFVRSLWQFERRQAHTGCGFFVNGGQVASGNDNDARTSYGKITLSRLGTS